MNDKKTEIKRKMQEEGFDVLLLHHPEDLVMAFDYYPFWGQSFGLYFQKEEPLLFVPGHEPFRKEFIHGVEVRTGTTIEASLASLKTYQMKYGIASLVIGGSLFPKNHSIPGNGAEQGGLAPDWWEKLRQAPNIQLKDNRHILEELSKKKSKTAIQKIKEVHQLAEIGLETFYQHLKEGISELAVSLAIEASIKMAGMKAGKHFVLCYAQIQAGKNTLVSGTYNCTTMNQLNEQDLVLLELAVCMDGYWLDLTRTGVVGQSSEKQQRQYEQIERAQMTAITQMKPGITLHTLYEQSREVLAKVNLASFYPHGLGHSVGYQYHDPGLAIVAESRQILEPGMVLTIEPGIYGEEIAGGMRIEDNLLVTETGVEWLSKGLRGLSGTPYLYKGVFENVEQ